ncbi:MAG TPA: hypothetical protein V6D02_06030, partial [Candidatus Obscuribacterales bacterium]
MCPQAMPTAATAPVFYQAWAQRYIRQVSQVELEPVRAVDDRTAVAQKLKRLLRSVSAEAWKKTEGLIAHEVVRHQIEPEAVDPWAIAQDVHHIFELTLKQYAESVRPERFAVAIAGRLGAIRDRYTRDDARVIAFVSMQFHYTGQLLLGHTHRAQQPALELYFKAIDDYLYMPLSRAYRAAAHHPYSAPQLKAVQRLLPNSSKIAHKIADQVVTAFPHYHSYSGPLASSLVRASSVRDVEMFQTYLWVCVLEGDAAIVQQELFPLCVMLYPVLNVRWELVRY